MLTDTQLLQLYHHLHLSKKAMTIIKSICALELPPGARNVRGNFSGRYPSHKMTSSIRLESRRYELPYIYQIEHDNKILEFFYQSSS